MSFWECLKSFVLFCFRDLCYGFSFWSAFKDTGNSNFQFPIVLLFENLVIEVMYLKTYVCIRKIGPHLFESKSIQQKMWFLVQKGLFTSYLWFVTCYLKPSFLILFRHELWRIFSPDWLFYAWYGKFFIIKNEPLKPKIHHPLMCLWRYKTRKTLPHILSIISLHLVI